MKTVYLHNQIFTKFKICTINIINIQMLFLYKRYTNVSNCLFSMLFTRCSLVLKVMYNSFNTSVAIMLFMLVAIMRIVKYKSTVIDAIKSPITSFLLLLLHINAALPSKQC